MISFLETWKKYLTWAALLSCFSNILSLTFSFYMFSIYQNIVVSFSGWSLANITVAAIIAIMSMGLFLFARSRLLSRAGNALNIAMREQTFEIMIKSTVIDPKRAYRNGLNDLNTLQNYLSTPAVYAVFDAPWAPFYLVLIFIFQPVLGMIATGGALLSAALTLLQEILVKDSMKEANRLNSDNQRFVVSFMRNAEVTVGMGMIANITDRFTAKNRKVMENQTRSSNVAGIIHAVTGPLRSTIQVLIYFFGAYFCIKSGFNAGLMVVCSIIMGQALTPIMRVTGAWRQTSAAREAYFRLKNVARAEAVKKDAMPLPLPTGTLTVDRVIFGLNGRVWLRGISFNLLPGEYLGIIGPSGAGKTTLCRLLLGIWPSLGNGKVYLDGRDIFAWNKDEIGSCIGYLPQEVELFPGTVAENIARLDSGEPEFLARAIEQSGCGPLIESLPQGLNTLIEGEEGRKLSGGQKQRIGLARALYGDPKFLILDEPTSNLDEAGEKQLLRALDRIKGKCTCIMVTHKPSLLQSMDKVLVVRDGLAAAFGPKDQVMAQLAGQAASGAGSSGGRALPAAGGRL